MHRLEPHRAVWRLAHQLELDQQTVALGPGGLVEVLVRDEVAQGEHHQAPAAAAAFHELDGLQHVRVVADHREGPRVDHLLRELPVFRGGRELVLGAPVDEDDQRVDLGRALTDGGEEVVDAVASDDGLDLVGHGRHVGQLLVLLVVEAVEPAGDREDADAQAVFLEHQRLPRLFGVRARAGGEQARLVEERAGRGDAFLVLIEAVVVGEGGHVDADALEGAEQRGLRVEHHLAGLRLLEVTHRRLEVDDGEVGALQHGADGPQHVIPPVVVGLVTGARVHGRDVLDRIVGDDVATEDERHARGRDGRLREEGSQEERRHGGPRVCADPPGLISRRRCNSCVSPSVAQRACRTRGRNDTPDVRTDHRVRLVRSASERRRNPATEAAPRSPAPSTASSATARSQRRRGAAQHQPVRLGQRE